MRLRRARDSRPPGGYAWLEFEQGEHSFFDEDERVELVGSGFRLRDGDGRAVEYGDERLSHSKIRVLNVAGTSHRAAELQDGAFAPGMPLALVPDPDNPVDKNAVGIWDRERKRQVGWIPAEDCESVSTRIQHGEDLVAFSLWEYRKDGTRCALRAIIGPRSALANFPTV